MIRSGLCGGMFGDNRVADAFIVRKRQCVCSSTRVCQQQCPNENKQEKDGAMSTLTHTVHTDHRPMN